MKKSLFLLMLATVSATIISCQKERESAESIDQEVIPDSYITVRVSMGIGDSETKAAFDDDLGLVWEDGDVVRWEGNTGNTTATLDEANITENGHRASFLFTIPNIVNESPRGVFRYNWSSANQTEWNFGNNERQVTSGIASNYSFSNGTSVSYQQSEAGIMNKSFLFMHSATAWETIPQKATAENEFTVDMKLLGSIFRVLPYTTDYNTETVESVVLQPRNSEQALGGLVFYNYGAGEYLDQNQKKYNWYKTATVTLGTGFSLTGVDSREKSKGIYFAVPATNSPLNGYTVIVNTDQARYTYSTTNDLNVSENKVRNIYVKLDAEHRLAKDAFEIGYEGGLSTNPYSVEHDYNSTSNQAITYWQAFLYNFDGSRVEGILSAASNPAYYAPTITITNDNDGTPATWVSLYYRDNNEWLAYDMTENDTENVRKATAVLTYPNVGVNRIKSGYETRTIKFTQTANVVVTPEIADLSATAVDANRTELTATLKLRTAGSTYLTGDDYTTVAASVGLSITSPASVSLDGTTLNIVIPKNFTTTPKNYTLTASLEDRSSVAVISQAAGEKNYTKIFTWEYDSWQSAGVAPGNRLFSRQGQSAAGWTRSPDAEGRGDWILVMNNFKDLSTGSFPASDVKDDIIKFVFDLTDEEFTTLNAWLPFAVSYVGTQVFITLTDIEANTGVYREFHKYAKNADYADFVEVNISQKGSDSAAPVSEWSSVTSLSMVKQYWAGTTAPSVDMSSKDSFTITAPAVKTWGGDWSAQNFILFEGIVPNSGKHYTFSFDIDSDCTAGIILKLAEWTGESDAGEFFYNNPTPVESGSTYSFSREFDGQARSSFVLIVDLGAAEAGSSWTFSNFDIKYR